MSTRLGLEISLWAEPFGPQLSPDDGDRDGDDVDGEDGDDDDSNGDNGDDDDDNYGDGDCDGREGGFKTSFNC